MPLPESDVCSHFIHVIINILGKHLQFVYVTELKIDIPSLTDLDSHIFLSLVGPD